MIKNRPHRLDLIYFDAPLFFVTFCTRNRRRIPSLGRAKSVLEDYARCAIAKFNVAVGRYVIMPDHIHLFVRGDERFLLSTWVGGLKRAMWQRWQRSNSGNRDSSTTSCATMKVIQKNGATFGTILFEPD